LSGNIVGKVTQSIDQQ